MAGFRIGDKTTAILGAVASLITFILGGAVGRKTASPQDTQTVVKVPPVSITVSPDLVPAVIDAYKERQEAARKQADKAEQAKRDEAAKLRARLAELEGKTSEGDK